MEPSGPQGSPKSTSFSIDLVNWKQINSSAAAAKSYQAVNWKSINWSKVNTNTLKNLNWGYVNLQKALKSRTFTIDKVDWSDIDRSPNANKIYNSIDWAKVNWGNAKESTLKALDWALIDLKEAKGGTGFSVEKVDWNEVNQSTNPALSYKAINWTSINTSKLDDIDPKYLPKTSRPTAGNSGSFSGPNGVQIDTNKLRSSLLASKETERSSNDDDRDGFTSQSNTSKSTYQYLLNLTGRPSIVKETSKSSFSQYQESGSISNTSEEINFYYYSYGQQGFSLAKFGYTYDEGDDADLNDPGLTFILESITSYQAFGTSGIAYENINFRSGGSPSGELYLLEPPTQLGGGEGFARSYSRPLLDTSDNIGDYYINRYLSEGFADQTKTITLQDSSSKAIQITTKPDQPFKGSLSYTTTDNSYKFTAQFFDFPLLNQDEVSWSSEGKFYSGGFDTFLEWRAQDEILFEENSPFSFNAFNSYDPSAWGRNANQSLQRAEFTTDYVKDDEYPSQRVTALKLDPMTGQYLSGEHDGNDQDIKGLNQYSYTESERFAATYADINSADMAWSYDPGLVASMDQQIDNALGRSSPWAADQPAIFTSYWPLA